MIDPNRSYTRLVYPNLDRKKVCSLLVCQEFSFYDSLWNKRLVFFFFLPSLVMYRKMKCVKIMIVIDVTKPTLLRLKLLIVLPPQRDCTVRFQTQHTAQRMWSAVMFAFPKTNMASIRSLTIFCRDGLLPPISRFLGWYVSQVHHSASRFTKNGFTAT